MLLISGVIVCIEGVDEVDYFVVDDGVDGVVVGGF